MADYVVDHLGAKKIALISQSDEYGKRGAESVVSRLSERKIPLVSNEVFNISDTDFTSQLSHTIQAGPDVLIVYGYPNPSAIITRQAKQLGLKAKIMGANSAGSRKYPANRGRGRGRDPEHRDVESSAGKRRSGCGEISQDV